MKFLKPSPFRLVIALIAITAVFVYRSRQAVLSPLWEQPTMGTVCHITVAGRISKKELATLRKKVDAELEAVNQWMSTWQPDTEISQFNRFQSLENFPVSAEFAEVVRSALAISKATGGAFDPTVKPLVDYWGFGPGEENQPLEAVREIVGWHKVHVQDGSLRKENPELQLDLSAIAKGFGVDAVAAVIRGQGQNDFLVEIGGEIIAAGTNPLGNAWRIGVESPEPGRAFGEQVFQTLELSDRAMATSGDYRNFRLREDGTRYSHIIDPVTGEPAETDVAAVSVLADSCMQADAVATALFVMGSERGFQWLETHPEFEAFFILHSGEEGLATDGFPLSD